MAKMNLLALEPHKISRDLGGYITYLYGQSKIGKSTFGSEMPSPLFMSLERGYNALGGVYAQDIMSWAEVKTMVKELKKPEVKEKFKSIIVDTVDIAATMCEKYICDQHEVDTLNKIGYGRLAA